MFHHIFKSKFLAHIFKVIKRRIFNISIDSSSLNIFSSLLRHLLQILERSNVLSQIYDILGFLISLHFALRTIDFSHPNLFKIYSEEEIIELLKIF